jgi:phage replication O-like protein O
MASPQKENGYTSIANEIMDRLCRVRVPGEWRQVLDFIIRKTYGWNKTEDQISLSQFVDGTGLSKIAVCKAVNGLIKMNLITKKGNVTQNGNDYIPTYCFIKNYEKWTPLPKKVKLPNRVIALTELGTKPLPNSQTTKDTITKDTITKDTITKDNKPRSKKPTDPRIAEFTKNYFEKYEAEFHIKPPFFGSRDGPTIRRMLSKISLEELIQSIALYFKSQDQFIKNNAYDIPRLEKFISGKAVGGYSGGGNGKLYVERQEEYDKRKYESALTDLGETPIRN